MSDSTIGEEEEAQQGSKAISNGRSFEVKAIAGNECFYSKDEGGFITNEVQDHFLDSYTKEQVVDLVKKSKELNEYANISSEEIEIMIVNDEGVCSPKGGHAARAYVDVA